LLQPEIGCNRKSRFGCAEVVEEGKFLWKILEKMARSNP
jgi:hypothetical protein